MRRDEPSRTFSILKAGSENGNTSRPHSSDDCSNAASRRRAKARPGRDGRDASSVTENSWLSQEWSCRRSFNSTPTVEKVVGSGTRVLANRNVTAFTRDYLAEYSKYDEKINISEIVDYLTRRGVKGKSRSLYSAVHVILKKEVKARGSGLHYRPV